MNKAALLYILSFFCFSILTHCASDEHKVPINSVTFFHLSDVELDSISTLRNSDGLYEVSGDFMYYALEMVELYRDSAIRVEISDNRRFKVNDEVIDKFDLESPFVVLFLKGSKYKIETGVYTDAGIQQMINDFFKKE